MESLDEDDRESLESARMEGLGALHAAAMKGNVDVCRYLVEVLKFDVNSVSTPELGMCFLFSRIDASTSSPSLNSGIMQCKLRWHWVCISSC